MKNNKNKILICRNYNDVFYVNVLMSFESKRKGNTFAINIHFFQV